MRNSNDSFARRSALGIVAVHFLVVVWHSLAHEVLSVKATSAQLAFIVPVIIITPIAAVLTLRKYPALGAILMTASMAGSLVFGLYFHFVADTIDHVAHVQQLEPAGWAAAFTNSAYLLLASEAAGTLTGGFLLFGRRVSREAYAA